MKKTTFPIIFIMILLETACKKEKTQFDECDDLHEIYENPQGFTYGFSIVRDDSVKYSYGVINPTNSDELAYWGGNTLWNFYKYNIVTKERVKLTDLIPQNPPKWHRNGWIVFNDEDNNIYKVKSSGDSLTQLTFTRDCFMPEWSLSGDTIICQKAFSSIGIYFIKADGSWIKYINYNNYNLAFPSWAPFGSVVINTSGRQLSQINLIDSSYTVLKTSKSSALGACWFPDGKKILWCADSRPMILDYETKEQHPIIPDCEKKRYMYPSISSDGRYAILTMEIVGFVSLNLQQSSFRIVKIDLQTGTEQILDLPN